MTCSRCQKDSGNDSSFCRFCGAPLHAAAPEPRRLHRLPSEKKIAGVCAGLAAYLRLDVTVVRLLWVMLSIIPGAIVGGVIAYAGAWLLIPEGPDTASTPEPVDRLFRSEIDRKVAGVCGGFAQYLHVDSTLVRLAFVAMVVHPGVMFCGVLLYVVGWIVIPLSPPARFEPAPV